MVAGPAMTKNLDWARAASLTFGVVLPGGTDALEINSRFDDRGSIGRDRKRAAASLPTMHNNP